MRKTLALLDAARCRERDHGLDNLPVRLGVRVAFSVVSSVVLFKLLAVFAVVGVGWAAGRFKVVGPEGAGVLTAIAFGVFTPALLFRTTAGIALAKLPWIPLAAYFIPTMLMLLGGALWQRLRRSSGSGHPAAPAIRGLTLTFSNTVQLGIPVVTALFGTAGLAIHIGVVSLHALILLTTGTILAETALSSATSSRSAVVLQTARRAVIHPVVLPILLGLAYHATGLAIPGPVDDVLAMLGQAVVPVSLVTIGLSLHLYGIAGNVAQAVAYSAGKLVLHPLLVLAAAYFVFDVRGLPLVVIVLCASLPIGSNVLLFAGRYETLQAQTTAAIVASTSAFLVTGALWLLLLTHLT
jgi:malonate transporter and related proteins